MKQNLTIDQILPVCHLDELYDNNPVLYRKYTRLKAIDKLCKYRLFDLKTEQVYCKWVIENQHYDIKKVKKW